MTTSIIQLFALVAGFSTAVFAATQAGSTVAEKPNILWIVTEDIGCDMTCYGTKGVHTPNMDQLAAEGALYTRAYTTASLCSPSRSSFMTGLYPHQVFSKNMRIEAPLKKKALPAGVDIFTQYLRDAGYAIALCGHGKKDWGFISPQTEPYDIRNWKDLPQKQPFFCQYQFYDTHRVNTRAADGTITPFLPCPEHPVDRSAIELHPYTSDTPQAREELGSYLENVNLLDMKIGKLLDDLKAEGLYENTIIVVMGDNGPPVFRGKGFLYERGLRMPLIIRIPERFRPGFKPGARIDELVSAMDMAPTFIDFAGGKIPEHLEGRIFLGPNQQPAPEYLFAMRDRLGDVVDRCRSVCSKKYKYIRNYVGGLTYYDSGHKNVAGATSGLPLFKEGKLSAVQAAYFETRPEVEVYDLERDPFELNNLAQDPAREGDISTLQVALDAWIQRTRDNGELEAPELIKEMIRRRDLRWAELYKEQEKEAKAAEAAEAAEAAIKYTAIAKPNILFIAIDDLRPELGCYGAEQIKTPNLDTLAEGGSLFLNAYSNISVCGASRASLMTSLRAIPRKRFTSYYSRADEDAQGIVTLPEHFKQFGYHTVSNGKILHVREDSPQAWSEAAWRTYKNNGHEPQIYNKYDMWLDSGSASLVNKSGRGPFYEAADVADNAYYDGRVCDKTIKDLKRLAKGDQPFFLACGFWRPHLPFNAPKKYWDLYDRDKIVIADNRMRPKDAPKGLKGSNELMGQYSANEGCPDDEAFHRLARHGYFACVSYIDAQVGKIMKTLEDLGLNENTIVIVWGDHGFQLGEHNLWGKHNTMDRSLRAPLIIRQPGKEAQRLDQIVEFVDIYPTLCDLASLPIPAHCEGKSIKPVMDDPSAIHKEAVFSTFGAVYAVKTQNFLYSQWLAGPPSRMLYDHQKDPQENVNVAELAEYSEEVERHHKLFEELRESWGK